MKSIRFLKMMLAGTVVSMMLCSCANEPTIDQLPTATGEIVNPYETDKSTAGVIIDISESAKEGTSEQQVSPEPQTEEPTAEVPVTPQPEIETVTTPVVEPETPEVVTIPPTAEPQTPAPAPVFSDVAQIVRTTSNLNLRTGPGTEYPSAGVVSKGTNVSRIAISDTWSKVVYKGNEYYMSNSYLELITDGETLDPNATEPEPVTQPAPETPPAPISGDIMDFSGWSFDDLATLDNTTVPFGYSANSRDALNRPTGSNYYNSLYRKYGADFIAPATPIIYLTMDEGYEAGYTPRILDTLKEKGVHATFFVTKQFVTGNPDLVWRMINEGHRLGNHTCKHPSAGMPSLSLQEQYDDIMWLQNYVKDNFGYEMTLFRYPTGAFSIQSLALLNKMGLRPVFWSFAHVDWDRNNQPDVAASLESAVGQVHPGAIYLLHAVSSTNTEMLGDFIDRVRAAGFEFGEMPAHGF